MLQISPQKVFPITWVNSVPGDSTTYYPRAVVKNAQTGATLATVDLSLVSTGYYSYNYTAPHDPSQTGTGLYITVTVSVYTDSGHTTLDQNFAVVSDQYLVKQILDANMTLGGGGVDYIEVRKILREELKKLDKEDGLEEAPLDFPTLMAPLVKELREEIKAVASKVESIKIPDFPEIPKFPEIPAPREVDISSLDSSFRSGIKSVLEKVRLIPTNSNYAELIEKLETILSSQEKAVQDQKVVARGYEGLAKALSASLDASKAVLDFIQSNSDFVKNNHLEAGMIADAISMVLSAQKVLPKRLLYKS